MPSTKKTTVVKDSHVKRGSVYWVNLDPSIGSESKKLRPAVVISNNIQNELSDRVVVVPITSKVDRVYPFEVKTIIEGKIAKIMADQIRAVDKVRFTKYICEISRDTMQALEEAVKLTLNLD